MNRGSRPPREWGKNNFRIFNVRVACVLRCARLPRAGESDAGAAGEGLFCTVDPAFWSKPPPSPFVPGDSPTGCHSSRLYHPDRGNVYNRQHRIKNCRHTGRFWSDMRAGRSAPVCRFFPQCQNRCQVSRDTAQPGDARRSRTDIAASLVCRSDVPWLGDRACSRQEKRPSTAVIDWALLRAPAHTVTFTMRQDALP